ncbi:DEAD/DEAH box helicase [Novipirellula artificiosorum]|uniref:ATP-dependent helicase HepA n=1 Tax=Novipirellula artificiosorum TaxID=2528016 RepID=A0A5C6E1G8_9BACT|nr:DEAD/DEAH box helicase [Novipirellula artificiosorum]TWU42752.1 ATP-dependent helicase HepA [Novipirellula artificiosorum]
MPTSPQSPSHQAIIRPNGSLGIVPVDPLDAKFGQGGSVPAALIKRFAKSTVEGLAYLVSTRCDGKMPPSIQFWRDFTNRYFRSLCRQQTPAANCWESPQCPDEPSLREILDAAPPMRGLEYASVALLQSLWQLLDDHTQHHATAKPGGLANYLHSLRPDWNLIGRVTFHLAENKKNPQLPFAFLATFTESQSGGVIKHVALAEALKRSIAENDTTQLDALLAPVSRAAETCELIDKMLDSRTLFSPQAWGIQQAYRFLSSVPQMEDAGVIVRVPNWWNASKPPRPQVQVKIGSRNQSMLSGPKSLDLDVNVSIDGIPLSEQELAELMAAREGMTLLRGKWVQVNQEQLQTALDQWKQLQAQHVTGVGFLEGLRMLSGASLGDESFDDQLRSWTRLEPGPWLKQTLDELREPSGRINIDPQRRLKGTLRPYQQDGVRWLWFATQLGLGVCLADDMGLGKTIQVISWLLQRKQSSGKKSKPSLLILPTSLLGNWHREVQRFGPDLKMWISHRSMTDAAELKRIAAAPAQELAGYDLVATTYGLARREKWLAEMEWAMVILDEAQAIKNAGAAQTKAIKAIPSEGRLILTGTPVENHLGDLWSLFDFCSPGLLGSAAEFKKFAKSDDPRILSQRLASIRQLIRPYVLRRMKTDPNVVPDLPDKTEMRVDCGLSTKQAALYKQVVHELEQSLDLATGMQRRGRVLSVLMQLKQICNHPALYLKQPEFAGDASGKLTELKQICETLIEKQEKVLVFTQFQSMCQPLAGFLQQVFGKSGLILTGKTPAKARNKMVETFQQDSGPPFFVISVKAGGTGLNLTQASHVVHFDRWWNPAVEDQATDRAFRIGQKKNVVVHKFVCRGTLEEKIDDMIAAKKEISRELFGSDGEIELTEMSNEQLMSFVALDLQKATTS